MQKKIVAIIWSRTTVTGNCFRCVFNRFFCFLIHTKIKVNKIISFHRRLQNTPLVIMSSYAAAAAPPSKPSSDLLPDPEDYGFLHESDDCGKESKEELSSYILGTLLVRVVAARKLSLGGGANSSKRRENSTMINPYASLRFNGQSQRTTECYATSDPIWPRGETMFMDVTLPLHMVCYNNDPKAASDSSADQEIEVEEPVLTVALFHNNKDYESKGRKGKKGKVQQIDGDSDEPFLGMASVDVRSLLTGKLSQFDEWVELSGSGVVRMVIEYEASDPSPRPGDVVRFNRFCLARDLYPIHPMISYQVTSVDDESHVTLSTTSSEGWVSTFQVHRYQLLCEKRHTGAVEFYQDELELVKARLAHSPMIHTLGETIQRLPEDGLFHIGGVAIQGGVGLLARWWQGGLDTVVGDVVHVTNWDGRHDPALDDESYNDDEDLDLKPASKPTVVQEEDDDDFEALPGMPCCPITGEPMRNPVVAADGHTYERSAIARWLQTSDKSPLTGSLLPHKELVPNYVLMSSLEEASRNPPVFATMTFQEEESTPAAVEHLVEEELKPAAIEIINDNINCDPRTKIAKKEEDEWKPVGEYIEETILDSGSLDQEDEWKPIGVEAESGNGVGMRPLVDDSIAEKKEGDD